MTRQQTITGAALSLAIVTLAFFEGGCGFESNQAACERALFHVFTCGSPSEAPPEYDFFIPMMCAPVSNSSECDAWPAYADCLTSVSCIDPLTDGVNPFATFEALDTCEPAELRDNGCIP